MVTKKLEEVENVIETKISNLSRNVEKISDLIYTTQTEQRLLKQEMESLNSKADTLLNKIITNCADILNIYPHTRGRDGVIQRRVNGSVDFYRNWTEYKNGFGFADHEYWIELRGGGYGSVRSGLFLGNDMLHRLTSTNPQELRVDMERFNGEKAYAVYSNFSVGDEASKYQLQVTGYSGNAGDSLDYHNNMKFSTLDQDNDRDGGNCATYWRSVWWFNSCFRANPNGQYTDSEKTGSKYVTWIHWKDSFISLKSIQLMIRPRA
uniref:Tenascin n=1 Tax=Magallana gigas TaxID=29159 RepID=K1RI05_MAGGI